MTRFKNSGCVASEVRVSSGSQSMITWISCEAMPHPESCNPMPDGQLAGLADPISHQIVSPQSEHTLKFRIPDDCFNFTKAFGFES